MNNIIEALNKALVDYTEVMGEETVVALANAVDRWAVEQATNRTALLQEIAESQPYLNALMDTCSVGTAVGILVALTLCRLQGVPDWLRAAIPRNEQEGLLDDGSAGDTTAIQLADWIDPNVIAEHIIEELQDGGVGVTLVNAKAVWLRFLEAFLTEGLYYCVEAIS